MVLRLTAISLGLVLSSVAVFSAAPSAMAMDCAKAKSPVEKTICADDELRALDDNLSRFYFGALKSLLAKGDKAAHDKVQNAQRNWIVARNACASKPTSEMTACVRSLTASRLGEIQTIGYGLDVVPPKGLTVGSELLTWGLTPRDGRRTLNHGGRIWLEEPYAGRSGPPFTILERWKSAKTDAVLIEAGEAATTDCSTIFVVESRQIGSVAVHDLGDICVGLTAPEVKRNDQGFVFASPSDPSAGGEIKQWRGKTGAVTSEKVSFQPTPGSTMRSLVSGASPEGAEPLQNAEFFAAVMRLDQPSRARALSALWQIANGCDTCFSEHADLYGVAMDASTVSYSGCGWYMHGGRLLCGQSDALAVWDRRSGEFYFATDEHDSDGRHNDMAPVEPALVAWPAEARARFEIWRKGEAWARSQKAR